MKLYQYFRKNDDSIRDNGIDSIPIYALTVDKDQAKVFEHSRDMNQFVKKVFKGSSDVCTEYINKHRGSLLDYYELKTFDNEKHQYEVLVLMTDIEYEMLDFDSIQLRVLDDIPTIDPTIFKDKYLEDLIVIGYAAIAVCKMRSYNRSTKNIRYWIDTNDIDMKIDELMCFIKLFSDTIDLVHFGEEILDYSELDEN